MNSKQLTTALAYALGGNPNQAETLLDGAIDAIHHHDEGAENMITLTTASGEAFVIVVAQQR